ncbi:VENN motif pre-toxin domain-containing protein [Paralysiella testudinis]|uniref:VENN motif pre-toxin domain-containing protein n=1 Tax=Paralysiella testudinis TaxID=2809020 RepID=A0A892ZGR7_9NEIS|nr:VENN motif pre-toxin domain-containing protein [Paralysiella testudinis]QRQ80936.1 VENN motif pre-toxin domain-containing protein [Paralysiella testudinis]
MAKTLYGKDTKDLSPEEKTTISSLSALFGAAVGVAGGGMADVVSGSQGAQNAVENNQLNYYQSKAYDRELKQCATAQNPKQCREDIKTKYQNKSDEKLAYSIYVCSDAARSAECHAIRKQNEYDVARLKQEYEQNKIDIKPVWDPVVGYTEADLHLRSISVEAAAKYWLNTGSAKPLSEWMEEQGYSLISGIRVCSQLLVIPLNKKETQA